MSNTPADYLIPNRRPSTVRSEVKRSDKVIWNTVKLVAERAGVDSHVHALRAVFAEACAEMGMDLTEIQDLMAHSRPETTQVYLDRRGREKRMEKVRDLSFGFHGADTPSGSRTRASAVRGQCPGPLDDGGEVISGSSPDRDLLPNHAGLRDSGLEPVICPNPHEQTVGREPTPFGTRRVS